MNVDNEEHYNVLTVDRHTNTHITSDNIQQRIELITEKE